jgi:hypothetical protein
MVPARLSLKPPAPWGAHGEDALLTRMGATISWRRSMSPEDIQSDEVWVTLVGEGPQPASGPLVLGATATRHGVASVVWVRVPNVRAALASPGPGRSWR